MDSDVMEVRIRNWLTLLETQARSGLNKQEWCKQNGVQRWQFFRWQKICREYLIDKKEIPVAEATETPVFVELPCVSENTAVSVCDPGAACADVHNPVSFIKIEYNGFTVSLDGDIDAKKLGTVLKVIANVR